MSETTGIQSAHERGVARLNAALRLATIRREEKPCGEGHWEKFISETQMAWGEAARLIDEALTDLGKLRARNNLKGGTT